jgi:hypothetical protein
MRFFLGAVCGVILTVLAAFIADSLRATDNPTNTQSRLVNWDVAGARVSSSLDAIREEVHDLTR